MRVLIYHTGTRWSGTARAAATLGRLLDGAGARVTASVRPVTTVEERFATEGLDVAAIPAGTLAEEVRRLRRVITDYFVEVVLVTSAREHWLAALALRMAGRGVVLRRVRSEERATGWLADEVAARTAPSAWVFATEAERQAGRVPASALPGGVVPMGVSTAHHDAVRPVSRALFSFSAGGPTIVCVGDAEVRRRAAPLLRAVQLLLPRHPALRLLMVGRGTDDDDLRMHAAALGITRVVRFLGERRDYLGIMRAADLGWVLADGDDGAWGCLDFMALRVPVLAPAASVARHYVADGITGQLLGPDDGPRSAAVMATLLARDEQRRRMGEAAHARVAREFPESTMCDGILRLVERARDRAAWPR